MQRTAKAAADFRRYPRRKDDESNRINCHRALPDGHLDGVCDDWPGDFEIETGQPTDQCLLPERASVWR